MITVSEYKDQVVGVFGLGKAGNAAIASLVAGGAKVFAWDDQPPSAIKDVSIADYKDWPWAEMKALVLSPGVPLTHPHPHKVVDLAYQHHVPVIGDVELLYCACPQAKYIAITGTNGKSTTTTLIGHILKSCGVKTEIGGNLGTPALALTPLGNDGVYVLELSSYQLDLVKNTHFNVAVWLNISPDHIDRHGSLTGYIQAKLNIFDRQELHDTAIVGMDDAHSRQMVAENQAGFARLVPVSSQTRLDKGVFVENGILHDGAFTADLRAIVTLTGRHNWQNAAAAYAAAKAIGLKPDDIYNAMKSFGGLRHRLQLVATMNGVRFINDSKATNADATSNALAPYEHIYWILGGKQKEGGIESLAEYFPKVAHAFLIGEAEDAFARTLEGKVSYTRCKTLETAVKRASEMAFAGGLKDAVVLLSPACASFDQWKNFEQRGDAFCQMVESMSTVKGQQ